MSILLVAPYSDLVKTAEAALKSTAYPVKIYLGDLESGLEVAQREIAHTNVQAIISRGGTASLLRNNLSTPVFEITVSSYDLLRAIYPYAVRNKKIAVVGYENIISGAKSIAEILGINLGYFLISQGINMQSVISEVHEWGADIVVGDTISVKSAADYGLFTRLVRSGPEAILSAVESAVTMLEHIHEEYLRNRRLTLIMEHSQMGILYLAANGVVQHMNLKAEKILNQSKEQLLGKNLFAESCPLALAKAVKEETQYQLVHLNGNSYMLEINRIQVEGAHVATLLFLESNNRIQDFEGIIRSQMISRGLVATYTFHDIVAVNHTFRTIIEKAKRYSQTNANILLLGETGCGKEMFAQSIHNASKRKDGPFVAVNCAALPDSLLESELFGYVEGAFTGARKGGKGGLFEMAHKGTIFLDEVNEMSTTVQARFLRVVQEKQVMRIGDTCVHDVDVRIIAASNCDLEAETIQGRFRKDLYYRLKVLDIHIPPLRKRQEDILPLFENFLSYFNQKYGYETKEIPQEMKQVLTLYHWPGNVRQLRNFAEKMSILLSVNLDSQEIAKELFSGQTEEDSIEKVHTLQQADAVYIRSCWETSGKNISETARKLGIDRATVRKYLHPTGARTS